MFPIRATQPAAQLQDMISHLRVGSGTWREGLGSMAPVVLVIAFFRSRLAPFPPSTSRSNVPRCGMGQFCDAFCFLFDEWFPGPFDA
jgi:hypothetical protein